MGRYGDLPWVQEIDRPTSEIDWDGMERFCEWQTTRGSDREYRGEEADDALRAEKKNRMLAREIKGVPGHAARDVALNQALSATIPALSFLGPGQAQTPQQRGVPVYAGTPAENAAMVTAALHEMGAADVGFVRLEDKTTRKLIYRQDSDKTHEIVFEDVAVGYETEQKRVIPQNAQWVIVYSVAMSHFGLAQAPSQLGRASTMGSYTQLYTIYNQLHEFLRALGYHSYGAANFNGFAPFVAFGVLAGLGELSRLDLLITPRQGPMVRLAALATDLPLEATRPIDFGVARYCRQCRICADACPAQSISHLPEPTWTPAGPWSNPGHRAYFRDAMKCRDFFYRSGSNCGVCIAKCPFSIPDPAEYRRFVAELALELDGGKPKTPGSGLKRDPAGWWKSR